MMVGLGTADITGVITMQPMTITEGGGEGITQSTIDTLPTPPIAGNNPYVETIGGDMTGVDQETCGYPGGPACTGIYAGASVASGMSSSMWWILGGVAAALLFIGKK